MSRVARGHRLYLPALLLALTQCAQGPASPRVAPASAARKPSGAPTPAQLSELSTRERELEKELRRTVQELAVAIGERNPDKKWELAEASDYLAIQLEEAGYAVERQGYELGEVI